MNITNSNAIGRYNPPIITPPPDIYILYNMILSYRARVIIGRAWLCPTLIYLLLLILSRYPPATILRSQRIRRSCLYFSPLQPTTRSLYLSLYLTHLSQYISPLTHCTYLLDAYATRVGDRRRGGAASTRRNFPLSLPPPSAFPLFAIYRLHRIMRINTRERSLQDQRRRYSIASLQPLWT